MYKTYEQRQTQCKNVTKMTNTEHKVAEEKVHVHVISVPNQLFVAE